MLQKLRSEPEPHAHLGETEWGEDVMVPLSELVKACGIVTGGTGAGKSMAACAIIKALALQLPQSRSVGFGVLDAKGELFERALYLLSVRLQELDGKACEELQNRIVIIDFSSQKAVSPYNILSRWPYTEHGFFINSRLETLRERLPSGEKLSLRAAAALKHLPTLLSAFALPLTHLNHSLES